MGYGKVSKVSPTLVNGKIARLMVMEFINGRMAISTKENGEHV